MVHCVQGTTIYKHQEAGRRAVRRGEGSLEEGNPVARRHRLLVTHHTHLRCKYATKYAQKRPEKTVPELIEASKNVVRRLQMNIDTESLASPDVPVNAECEHLPSL